MSHSLKDKVAIITGSTSGIGLGLAQSLAAEGADIMLNGLATLRKSTVC
jgi:3-hydroxybutyrate dehydrogenase